MSTYTDLHRHLDGSLRETTVRELAGECGRAIPNPHRFVVGMGLSAALDLFSFTLSLLQQPDAVRRVASETCEDAGRENVSALEIRFAPQLHRGAPPEEIVDAALDGIAGRAGLILCVLYGEPPDVAERLVDIAKSRPGVVGIDVAGAPTPEHRVTLADYAPAFQRAAKAGLGRTVHASEGRSPQEILVAVEQLGAQRIGHGTTLLEDDSVLRLVVEQQITIEACPTSNVHTGIIPSVRDHPLARWLRAGVSVCVNTDNTYFSAVDAPQEMRRVAEIDGVGPKQIAALIEHGNAARFIR